MIAFSIVSDDELYVLRAALTSYERHAQHRHAVPGSPPPEHRTWGRRLAAARRLLRITNEEEQHHEPVTRAVDGADDDRAPAAHGPTV